MEEPFDEREKSQVMWKLIHQSSKTKNKVTLLDFNLKPIGHALRKTHYAEKVRHNTIVKRMRKDCGVKETKAWG